MPDQSAGRGACRAVALANRSETARPSTTPPHEPGRGARRAIRQRVHRQSPHSTMRSEEHTSELQSHLNLVCRLLLEKKKKLSQKKPVLRSLAYTTFSL